MAADRTYLTKDLDMIDMIAYLEYGISSKVTEVLLDENYRIADNPIQMPAGITVELPQQTPPLESSVIKIWS